MEYIGQKFNRLTVMGRGPNTNAGAPRYWCLCDCGSTTLVRAGALKGGHTKSCGCWRSDCMKQVVIKYRPLQTGAKSPNWKGGNFPEHLLQRSSKEYREWRGEVFKRDNYT